jgi:hypothetical protein
VLISLLTGAKIIFGSGGSRVRSFPNSYSGLSPSYASKIMDYQADKYVFQYHIG